MKRGREAENDRKKLTHAHTQSSSPRKALLVPLSLSHLEYIIKKQHPAWETQTGKETAKLQPCVSRPVEKKAILLQKGRLHCLASQILIARRCILDRNIAVGERVMGGGRGGGRRRLVREKHNSQNPLTCAQNSTRVQQHRAPIIRYIPLPLPLSPLSKSTSFSSFHARTHSHTLKSPPFLTFAPSPCAVAPIHPKKL